MITKRDVAETLHLSCVENYFLAWIGKTYEVSKLYGNSFIGIGKLFDDFCHGATYESYHQIPRIQEIAEKYGIVQHAYYRCSAKESLRLLREQSRSTLCLVRVNANFFAGYKRAAWREDHYICIDEDMFWLNQYPLSEGKYEFEEFCRVFDGSILLFKLDNLSVEPPDLMTDAICEQKFEKIQLPKELNAIESAIGVLRITRKRMAEYYSSDEALLPLFERETKLLDEIYFLLRMMQIKGIESERKEEVLRQKILRKLEIPLQSVYLSEQKIREVLRNERVGCETKD